MTLRQRVSRLFGSALAKDAGLYFGFKILDKIVPFLLLPIVARALGPAEYGIFVLFQALAGMILPAMSLSVDSSILLNYFKVSARAFPAYFSSGYRLLLGWSTITFVLLLLARGAVGQVAGFPSEWVGLIALFCWFQFNTNLALNLFQARKQPVQYGSFAVALTVLKNASVLVLVLVFDLGWLGVAGGYVGAQGVFAVISVGMFYRQGLLSARTRRVYVRDNFKVGYPLSAHQLGAWASSSATRVIVASVLGTASAGSFGVGAAIAMLVMFVQTAFNKAFVPYLFELLGEGDPSSERRLVLLTYGYVGGLIAFALVVGLAGTLLVEPVFGAEFRDGSIVVLPLCLAYAFEGGYKMHVNYIFYSKRTHLILLITGTTAVVNLILSIVLIDQYGLLGSALSLCLINALGYVLAWIVGQRVRPMNWALR